MNQESKQIFSTIQQVKLRQLELEVEALEQQIKSTLQIEIEDAEAVMQSSASYIRIDDIQEQTVVKIS